MATVVVRAPVASLLFLQALLLLLVELNDAQMVSSPTSTADEGARSSRHRPLTAKLRRDEPSGSHRASMLPGSMMEHGIIHQLSNGSIEDPYAEVNAAKRENASNLAFSLQMPGSFNRFFSDLWRGYVWQIYAHRMGPLIKPKAQLTNVVCNHVEVSSVKIKAMGAFGQLTRVDMDLASKCKGAFCWQWFGWRSQGTFASKSEGTLQFLFPPVLPEIGEKIYFNSGGENGAWCRTSEDNFTSEIDYKPTKDNSKMYDDGDIWRDTVCGAVRRKIEWDEATNSYHKQARMHCGFPWIPAIIGLIAVLFQFMCCVQVYRFRVQQYHRWLHMDNVVFEYYKLSGSPPSQEVFEQRAGPPPQPPCVLSGLADPLSLHDVLLLDDHRRPEFTKVVEHHEATNKKPKLKAPPPGMLPPMPPSVQVTPPAPAAAPVADGNADAAPAAQ